jgi:hypothetical protein
MNARTSVDIDIFTRGALSNRVGIILLPSPQLFPIRERVKRSYKERVLGPWGEYLSLTT